MKGKRRKENAEDVEIQSMIDREESARKCLKRQFERGEAIRSIEVKR